MSNPKPERLTNTNRAIRIRSVKGGNDGIELLDCFFFPTTTPGVYLFCTKDGVELAVDITAHKPFHFNLHGHRWTIPNPEPGSEPFTIDEHSARGSWRNDHSGDPAEEGGTFTAQASGGADEEESASSANA